MQKEGAVQYMLLIYSNENRSADGDEDVIKRYGAFTQEVLDVPLGLLRRARERQIGINKILRQPGQRSEVGKLRLGTGAKKK